MAVAYSIAAALIGSCVAWFGVANGLGVCASASLGVLAGVIAGGVVGIIALALSDSDQDERRF